MDSLFTRSRTEAWRSANPTPSLAQLDALMSTRREVRQARYGRAYRASITALRVVFVLLVVLVMTLWFFLFGEERPERVRPNLTPAQRARAFRLPTP